MNKINKSSGFTLIELLVVLVILGMLAGLVGPRIMKQLGTAKSNTAKLQIEDLGAALDIFYLDNGRYPTTLEGMNALVQKPSGFDNWNRPYLKKNKVPKDPWSIEYQYASPVENGEYDLYSYGADKQPGGDGKNKDINSWE